VLNFYCTFLGGIIYDWFPGNKKITVVVVAINRVKVANRLLAHTKFETSIKILL